jgi:thiosulfate/3-mercaptopyruvate sulfurtransferase
MTYANADALVATAWLAERLGDAGIRIVDATWYLPNVDRSGRDEYAERHIPGAVFWDLDAIADAADPLPHMLPDAADFARHMARLGIGDGMKVVVYDTVGSMTAPRVWWMLRSFGHDDVALLDGGLVKWLAEGRPTDAAAPALGAGQFSATVRPAMVRDVAQVRANLDSAAEQLVDARGPGRFAGTEPELRPNCRSGHIPGSLNLPYTGLIDGETKTFLAADALAERFAASGIDAARPVVTTCGSGVTACVLALGLHLLGRDDVAVYDGSWTEWGSRDDTPIET